MVHKAICLSPCAPANGCGHDGVPKQCFRLLSISDLNTTDFIKPKPEGQVRVRHQHQDRRAASADQLFLRCHSSVHMDGVTEAAAAGEHLVEQEIFLIRSSRALKSQKWVNDVWLFFCPCAV